MEEATQQARRHVAVPLPWKQRSRDATLASFTHKKVIYCFLLTESEQEQRPEGETYFLAHLSDCYPSSSGMTDACYFAVIPSNLLSLS